MNVTIRPCNAQDVDKLGKISADTFYQTFADSNSAQNMEQYLHEAYNRDKLLREMNTDGSQFYFAYWQGELAGYCKINRYPAQTEFNDEHALEIERLYVLTDYKAKGIGSAMMNHALNLAALAHCKYVWLGVWEHNYKARNFYSKFGFYQIGSHVFTVGDDDQTDLILRKDL